MISTRDLTIQQLRCFIAVAQEQNFTAAADELGVAQPSISSQIHRLEQVLATPLFHRGRRPVTLTDAGLELVPLARRVLRSLDDVVQGVSDVDGLRRGHVTIGATPSLGSTLLPNVLATFHVKYPGVSLSIVERDSVDLAEQLESGALDLALVIMPLQRATLEDVVLGVEELVVAVAIGHPLAERTQVSMNDLRDVPMIMFREGYELRATTLAAFDRAGFPATVALDGVEMGSVHSFVAAGIGAAIVPSIVATDVHGLRILRLRSPSLKRTLGLVRPLNHTPSRATAALSQEITEYLSQSGWPGPSPRRSAVRA